MYVALHNILLFVILLTCPNRQQRKSWERRWRRRPPTLMRYRHVCEHYLTYNVLSTSSSSFSSSSSTSTSSFLLLVFLHVLLSLHSSPSSFFFSHSFPSVAASLDPELQEAANGGSEEDQGALWSYFFQIRWWEGLFSVVSLPPLSEFLSPSPLH